MKRSIALLLVLLCLALAACGGEPTPAAVETPPIESDPGPAESVPTVSGNNPLLAAQFLSIPSGNAKYGYVNVSREDLPDFSTVDFSDMLSEFMDRRVVNYNGNYIIIDFGDGTGLHCLLGNLSGLHADYCEIIDGSAGYSYGYFVRNSLDESFTYTDFHIRKISNPTFQQEALVPDNYFEPVNGLIFNTTADENGLADSAFYVEGDVISREEAGGYDTIRLSTPDGDLYISAVSVPFGEIAEGDSATVFFVYAGWSNSLEAPAAVYVYHE